MFHQKHSERSTHMKPKFQRLKLQEQRRKSDLDFYADDDFLLHIKTDSVHARKFERIDNHV